MVASSAVQRASESTKTSLLNFGVTLTDGVVENPFDDLTVSYGIDAETSENDAVPSLMASVLPLIVTEIVLLPVVDAARYQISVSLAVVRVLVAFVNAAPFHETEPMVPLPPTSCQMPAVRTMSGFEPLVVTVQVLVVVLLKPSVMLVVDDVRAITRKARH